MIDTKSFSKTISASTLVLLLLLYMIASSHMAVALMPALGVGGIYAEMDSFEGVNALIYPEHGTVEPHPEQPPSPGVTATSECRSRPMLVMQFDQATVNGYYLQKDVPMPWSDRWLSIQVDQPNGTLTGDSMQLYTTQLEAAQFTMFNIELIEGRSEIPSSNWRSTFNGTRGGTWGPQSEQFRLVGDPEGNSDTFGGDWDIRAQQVALWGHALTGDGVNFIGNSTTGEPVSFGVDFPTTQQLRDQYAVSLSPGARDREEYFDCLPPFGTNNVEGAFLFENFGSGALPAGWTTSGTVNVNNNAAYEATYSAQLDDSGSTLTTPSIDLTGSFRVPTLFWIKEGTTNSPTDGDYLYVQFKDENGNWINSKVYRGGDPGTEYEFGTDYIPESAIHSDFQMRFVVDSDAGGSGGGRWHVDYVHVG